jgi:pimeloyl-ACP methyl ester carboxylesterase
LGIIFLAALCLSAAANGQQTAPWRYDLRPGDHLIYRYTFERETSGKEFQTHTKAVFTTHVLVLGEQNGRLSVGFQRNRESAQLLASREKGKDNLAQELPNFEQRMAKRPSRFHEANEFSATGEYLNYWQAARESPSKVLLALHEIEPLPEKPVAAGDKWKNSNILGFEFRFVEMENLSGKPCARVEGASETGRIRYWWCSETGVLGKIEFEGQYFLPGNAVAHEKLSFELQEKRRGENVTDWLKSADMQRAALDALLLSRWVPVASDSLSALLETSAPETQALALAVIYQRGLAPPKPDLLTRLAQGENAEVARIASRLLEAQKPPAGNGSAPARSYPLQKLGTSLRAMADSRFRGYPFALHVPKDYRGDRPFPLLVYLSGGGGFAMDAVNTAEDVIAPTDYLVLYPQAGDMWWKPEIRDRFDALLKEVLQELNVDPKRIYIAGFSNGGTGTLDYATFWPKRFAAAVSLMGAGTCQPEIADRLREVRDLPVLLVHGDKDSIIPDRCSRDTYNALRKLSSSTPREIRILKGRGHDITLQSDDGFTLPFFENKVLGGKAAK